MNEPNDNSQNKEEELKNENPYHDNGNVYENKQSNNLNKENPNKKPDNDALNDEESLKKEIINLKNQHLKDEKTINDLRIFVKNEINLLRTEIKKLKEELDDIKNKKNKNSNNINNINNINNDNNESDVDMEDPHKYSIECLSKRLNIEILQGTEKADIKVMIRNNSNEKLPQNSFLISDNRSLLLCEKCKLNELEPKQQQNVTILFKNLKYISKGKYNCYVKLEVNNKMYNSFFEIIVDVLENNQNKNFQQPNFQPNFMIPPEGNNFGNNNVNCIFYIKLVIL